MPLIVKGKVEIKTVDQQSSQVGSYTWDSVNNRIVKTEEQKPEQPKIKVQPKQIQIVHKQVVEKETVGPPEHYHQEHHGDLHKFLNTKSDYLKDMIDFDSNK